jgi:uncharacterized radical SAM superfamily Fe-S cluster-containing enzyme
MALVEPRPVKLDRDEVFLEYTKSICPVCKTVVDAELNVRDNRVILRKRCREHGLFEALVYSDAEMYLAQQRFNKPGTIPLEFQTEVASPRRTVASLTGLEPATSGVTGRSGHNDARRRTP